MSVHASELSRSRFQESVEVHKIREASRVFDCFAAATLLLLASPLLAGIAAAIFLETGLPLVFRQKRVGRNGNLFTLLKFRTMRVGSSGPSITVRGDSRVTRAGKVLRKFKLDELPQLWNVVRGDMSLVGPRPEVPEYVDGSDPVWQAVLRVRPGITDPASIAFRNEEELLAKASDPFQFYKENLLPAKLSLNLAYLEKRSLWLDIRVLLETARCAVLPGHAGSKQDGI
jgi:lipopolysaccharide/colanic/teichoic acid biosynthesis glycosyltransferase